MNNLPQEAEILLYSTDDGTVKIDVLVQDDTLWLTQMAELFQASKQNIGQHLKNILSEGELVENSVVKKFFTTANDGKTYQTKYYNLDAIIAVGYRVNSKQATHFRIWATKTLREFIIKGFVLDSQRLKNGQYFGKDYFDELLENIREIRASERRFYQKITDIYAECSADYDPKSPITQAKQITLGNSWTYRC